MNILHLAFKQAAKITSRKMICLTILDGKIKQIHFKSNKYKILLKASPA